MKLVLFVCAESAIIDSRTNRLSLIGLYEDLNVEGFPLMFNNLAAVLVVRREKGDPDSIPATLDFSVDSIKIGEAAFDVVFEGDKVARVITSVQGIVVSKPGRLKATIRVDGRKFASWEPRVSGPIGGAVLTAQSI